MNEDKNISQKEEVQRQTVEAINQASRGSGFASMPFRLPALVTIFPAWLTDKLLHNHVSKTVELILVLAVFIGFQLLIGLYLRSFLRRHPDLKWQILIR